MRRVVQRGSVLFLLLLIGARVEPQENRAPRETPPQAAVAPEEFEYQAECGNPILESMAWNVLDGRVTKVRNGSSLRIRTSEGEDVRVDLVAIDTRGHSSSARELLATWTRERTVRVVFNRALYGKRSLVGVVEVDGKDLNRELLRAGVARYREPPSYSVSSYTACRYRIAEREARNLHEVDLGH